MSAYYTPPRPRASSGSPQLTQPSPTELHTAPALTIAEQSIYIFPTPSSLPASPGGSSVFSAPSDFTDFFGSDTRSRNRSANSSLSPVGRSPRLHFANAETRIRRQRPSPTGSALDSDVSEVWDWAAESGEDVPDQDGYWEFEEEIERVGQWDIVSHRRHEDEVRRTHPLSTSSFPVTNDFIDQHYRVFLRSRTQSNSSSLTTNSRGTNSSTYTPHPRIHIPLLSFIASLLFLDLDDPALRLLNYSSPDSILFPGQTNLLGSSNEDGSASIAVHTQPERFTGCGDDEELEELAEQHGLLRLLTEGAQWPVKAIRDGLSVVCDPSIIPDNPLRIPGLDAIQQFGRFVGGTLSRGGQAWREIRLDGASTT